MARLAYLLLCHQDAGAIIRQARMLTSQGDSLAIHIDARTGDAVFRQVHDALKDTADIVFARRVACGWGEWSLVQATLNAVEAALERFPFTTHFYLVSGECMPIKPAAYLHRHLDAGDADIIESKDFFTSGWIKTGLKEERLAYRHYFNERRHRKSFYRSLALQQRLGLARKPPEGVQVRIGSQWWCLRRGTVEKVMAFLRARPDVVRFFRRTWIPDEIFFQTLVAHLVPAAEIHDRPPTFLKFSDYGMPVTFHADHFDFLRGQQEFFARKVPVAAKGLRDRLQQFFGDPATDLVTASNGTAVIDFVTGQGRQGTRFAPRIWERDATLGAGRLLLVLVCKKWHVAGRLGAALHQAGGPQCYGYVFDGNHPDLPAMGGYEKDRANRLRHRRAFLNLLARSEQTDRLTICLDTSNTDALLDLAGDNCQMHVLDIGSTFDTGYLLGHAERIGLGGPGLGGQEQADLAETIRRTFTAETAALRRLGLPALFRIRPGDPQNDISETLAGFSGIHPELALRIASDPALFD